MFVGFLFIRFCANLLIFLSDDSPLLASIRNAFPLRFFPISLFFYLLIKLFFPYKPAVFWSSRIVPLGSVAATLSPVGRMRFRDLYVKVPVKVLLPAVSIS